MLGAVLFAGVLWTTTPHEAYVTISMRAYGSDGVILVLERDGVISPCHVGPEDAAGMLAAFGVITQPAQSPVAAIAR